MQLESTYLTKTGGGELKFSIQNLSARVPVNVQLTQRDISKAPSALVTLKSPDGDHQDYTGAFVARFTADQLASFSIGDANLIVTAGPDRAMGAATVYIALRDLTFSPTGIYQVDMTPDQYSPYPKQLAIGADMSILAIQGGKATGLGSPIQQLKTYSFIPGNAQLKDALSPPTVTRYQNLNRALPGDAVFAISSTMLVLSYVDIASSNQVIQSCPLTSTSPTCLPEPADSLMLRARALGSDTAGSLLVAVKEDGALVAFDMTPAGINPKIPRKVDLDLKGLTATRVLLGVADVDGDSHPDVLAIHQSASDIRASILRSQPDGSFADQETLSSALTSVIGGQNGLLADLPISAIAVGDLDHDAGSLPDLAVARSGVISFYLNQGKGTFRESPTQLVPQYSTAGQSIDAIALADLNGDSLGDVIIAGTANKLVGVYLNTSPH